MFNNPGSTRVILALWEQVFGYRRRPLDCRRTRSRKAAAVISCCAALRQPCAIAFAIVLDMREWDIYLTSEVEEWLDRLQVDDRQTAELVDDAIYALSRSGPTLGRPLVETVAHSTIRAWC